MKKTLMILLSATALWSATGYWKIQKVQSWDTLNIREKANHKSAKVGTIPANAQCVINHGCGKDIALDVMMNMEEAQVKSFLEQAQEGWCYIEYKGNKGWVNQRYLSESQAQCK